MKTTLAVICGLPCESSAPSARLFRLFLSLSLTSKRERERKRGHDLQLALEGSEQKYQQLLEEYIQLDMDNRIQLEHSNDR